MGVPLSLPTRSCRAGAFVDRMMTVPRILSVSIASSLMIRGVL